ncbi:MAG: 2-hydroxychromene-2-carboxylate isomerase [Parvibaculum sp.]
MTKSVEFYFDYASPTAYLAWTQLPLIARRTGATIIWKPMFLGGVMQGTGNQPPGTFPPRGKWMSIDLPRWARRYGVPFAFNKHFPVMTLPALRITAGLEGSGEYLPWIDAVFIASWVDGKNAADPAVLAELAVKIGLDPDMAARMAADPANKDKIRATTEEAIARGAFGAPTFFVGNEFYFGQDRLSFIEEELSA